MAQVHIRYDVKLLKQLVKNIQRFDQIKNSLTGDLSKIVSVSYLDKKPC